MHKAGKYIWFIMALLGSYTVTGQDLDRSAKEVLLRNERTGFIEFRSNGWTLGYRTGKFKTAFLHNTWEVSFGVVKDWKQIKTSALSGGFSSNSRYYYGKLMNFYNVKLLKGKQKLLTTKPYWGGVEFRRYFSYGINLGIGKPTYVYVYHYDDGNTISLERFDPDKYDYQDIYGPGPFSKGLNELMLYPAASLKYAISAEYGQYNHSAKAIEVGATADFYPLPVQIMGGKSPSYFLASIYLAFHFGKRFNE